MKLLIGSSAVMRHSMAQPFVLDLFLLPAQTPAVGDGHHFLDDIHTRHQLGDRVLDLQAGVHLQEVEAAALIQQELHGAGAVVADRLGGLDGHIAHARSQVGVDRHRRRLLDQLLMAALNRAFPLAQAG
jgi:hypothetical protein